MKKTHKKRPKVIRVDFGGKKHLEPKFRKGFWCWIGLHTAVLIPDETNIFGADSYECLQCGKHWVDTWSMFDSE